MYTKKFHNIYVLIPPNIQHSEESISDKNVLVVLGFEVTDLSIPVNESILYEDSSYEIGSIIDKLLQENQNYKPYNKEIEALLVSEIVYKTLTFYNKEILSKTDERISMIQEYIDNYYNTKLDFDNISTNFYYSYDYIRHLFKEKTGLSIKQYVVQTRINNAKKLLLEGECSNKIIAKKCGFSSPSHLASCFLQETGQTPSEYKKNAKQIDYGSERFSYYIDEQPSLTKKQD